MLTSTTIMCAVRDLIWGLFLCKNYVSFLDMVDFSIFFLIFENSKSVKEQPTKAADWICAAFVISCLSLRHFHSHFIHSSLFF